MEKIVSLHGGNRGFVRFWETDGKLRYETRGVPENAEVYVVMNDDKVKKFSERAKSCDICGVMIVKLSSIIMYGVSRGCHIDIEAAKRRLRFLLESFAMPVTDDKPNAPTQNTDEISKCSSTIPAGKAGETMKSEKTQKTCDNKSEALAEILKTANKLFGSGNSVDESRKTEQYNKPRTGTFNPFWDTYPDSSWRRLRRRDGRGYYLEGIADMEGETLIIHAIPGTLEHNHAPKNRGFDRFLRSVNGQGYWIRVRRLQNKR